MTMTRWKWRLYLFIRAAHDTPQLRDALAQIYVDHGSFEDFDDERLALNNAVRLSTTGQEPAVAVAINTPAKTSMANDFRDLIAALPDARYAVVANVLLPDYRPMELVLTNFPVTPQGQIVTWRTALQYVESEFGLIPIPPGGPE